MYVQLIHSDIGCILKVFYSDPLKKLTCPMKIDVLEDEMSFWTWGRLNSPCFFPERWWRETGRDARVGLFFSHISLWHRCEALALVMLLEMTRCKEEKGFGHGWCFCRWLDFVVVVVVVGFVGICQSLLETNMETWSNCCLELEVELYLTEQPLETCEICLRKSSNSERVLSTTNTQLQSNLSSHAIDKPLFTNRRDDLYTTHRAPLNLFWTFWRWGLFL